VDSLSYGGVWTSWKVGPNNSCQVATTSFFASVDRNKGLHQPKRTL
jgi:hypothetical protein